MPSAAQRPQLGNLLRVTLAGAHFIAAVILFAMLSSRAAALDPRAIVEYIGTQGLQAVNPSLPRPERMSRLRALFQAYFDVAGLGNFVLGRYLGTATPQQQQEFLSLYREYTVQSYAFRLTAYSGQSFRVTGVRRFGQEVAVTSDVGGMQLGWRLINRGGQYKVTDVVVGGVSMRATHRDDVGRWVQNNGGRFDAVLAVLRQEITLMSR